MPTDFETPSDDGIFEASFCAEEFSFIRVFFKAERVLGNEFCLSFLEGSFIGNEFEAIIGSHEEVMRAFGADEVVLLQIEGMKHFPAVGTFGPKIIRNVICSFCVSLEAWFIEDAHRVK